RGPDLGTWMTVCGDITTSRLSALTICLPSKVPLPSSMRSHCAMSRTDELMPPAGPYVYAQASCGASAAKAVTAPPTSLCGAAASDAAAEPSCPEELDLIARR